MKDKNLTAIGDIVSKTADAVVATEVTGNPRVLPAAAIQHAWSGICKKITACPHPDGSHYKNVSFCIAEGYDLHYRFALPRPVTHIRTAINS